MERSTLLTNLPNLLSFARLTLSPLLLIVPQEHLLLLFLPLAFSDALDGFLARRLRAKTELGKVLDPLADKVMLLCGLLVCTIRMQLIPSTLLYAVLARDMFLLLGGLLLTSKNRTVPASRPLGKAFTFSLSLLIMLCILGFLSEMLLWATLLLLMLSWTDYALFGLRNLKSQTSSLASS